MRARLCVLLTAAWLTFTSLCRGQVETYVPFHVGDSWTYVNDEGATRVFSVISEREINGVTYFEFDDFFSPCGFPGWPEGEEVEFLFRRGQDSNLLFQHDLATASDVVRYDFSGDPWGPFGNQLVDTGLAYVTPAGVFGDSVRFNYATLVDCGVFHETLAPGIGTVGFYSSWEGEYRLQSYAIVSEPVSSFSLLNMMLVVCCYRRFVQRSAGRHANVLPVR